MAEAAEERTEQQITRSGRSRITRHRGPRRGARGWQLHIPAHLDNGAEEYVIRTTVATAKVIRTARGGARPSPRLERKVLISGDISLAK